MHNATNAAAVHAAAAAAAAAASCSHQVPVSHRKLNLCSLPHACLMQQHCSHLADATLHLQRGGGSSQLKPP
jgi:hypothetical protein